MAISYYATLFSRNVNKPKPAFRGHQLSGLLPVKSIPVPPFMERSWNNLYWPSFAFADFLWILERSLFAFPIPFLRPLPLSLSFSTISPLQMSDDAMKLFSYVLLEDYRLSILLEKRNKKIILRTLYERDLLLYSTIPA